MPPAADTPLSPAELARYSRQIILPGHGLPGQERLASARVLLVGQGGLGSPAGLYLAAAGVGTLGLADFDTVALHNLHRQVLHDTPSVGQPKVDSAAARLAALNPHVRLHLHPDGLNPGNILDILSGYDLIVDGSDNFSTRYLVNDAAVLAGLPLIYGSIFQFEGQVSCFHPRSGFPCYRCLFPQPPPPGAVPNCAEAGVLGALCGVIGSLQSLEALRWITGGRPALGGQLLVVDGLTLQFRRLNLKPDPACPCCGRAPTLTRLDPAAYDFTCDPHPSPAHPAPATPASAPAMNPPLPLELPPEAAQRLLQQDSAAVLDVREPYETSICRLPGSLLIPMSEIPARLPHLPRDRPLLVLCHHGGRSLRVTQYLRSHGFDQAANIAGGIDLWARRIDPTLARY